jgi:hypothetical protein
MVFASLAVIFTPAVEAVNVVNGGYTEPPPIVTYPAGNPPTPPVPDDIEEGAYAFTQIGIVGGRISGKYENGCLRITGMTDITVTGQTTLYEPNDITPDLHDHEVGHHKLSKYEFNRMAVKKLKAALKDFENINFCAPTAKAALALANAEKQRRVIRARDAIYEQMEELNIMYDDEKYTDGNDNEDMTPDEAVEKVKVDIEKKRKQKKTKRAGDKAKPAPLPPPVPSGPPIVSDMAAYKRGQEGAILWDPGPGINPWPGDVLHNLIKVIISNLVHIGKMDDYRQHFSDATATFVNINDPNEVYFNSGILEITLEPSNNPSYTYMLHGVWDIWLEDLNGLPASDWLTEIQAAVTEDKICGFWVYFDDPLLDADGQMIADDASVPCEIVFGPIDPEPIPGVIQENFDAYPDTATLQAEWPATNAIVELTDDTAQGAGAMLFEYDTTGGPAEATHMYPATQDWLAPGMTNLELWLNTDPNEPDVLENLTVLVFTGAGAFGVDVLGDPQVHAEITDDGYAAVSIPFDALSSANLNDVQGVGLMLLPDQAVGAVSSFMIDEIRLAEKPADWIPTADLDEDFKVTMSDFAIFAEQWLDGTQ